MLIYQKKLLCLLLSLFIAVSAFSDNQKVFKIEINGNTLISETKILLLLKTKVNEEFNMDVWKQDVENLSLTPYFSRIDYKINNLPEGAEIILSVVENPQISAVSFFNAKVFKKEDLVKTFDVKKGDFFRDTDVKKAIENLKKKYGDKGFYFTDISYKTVGGQPGFVALNIYIKEASVIQVGKITFTGNEHFSNKKLKSLLAEKERRVPFIMGSYKPDILDSDIENLVKFYHNNGFPECKIDKNVQIEKKRLTITINIDEGTFYYFGKTDFQGEFGFSKEVLQSRIKVKEGDVFSQDKLDESVGNIKTLYVDQGFLNAEIIPIPQVENSKINYSFYITPGDKIKVNEVIVTGNTITKDKVIRREIKLSPGDYFSGTGLRKSYNNLSDLGYFDAINLYPKPTENPQTMDLIANVKEKEKTGVFMVGGGYSSVDKLIGLLSVEQSNFDITNPPSFTGGGQDLKLMFNTGTVSKGGDLSFTEPYFLDKPISIGPDFYSQEYQWTDYTEKHTGGDLRVGRRWDNFSVDFKLMSESVKLSNILIPAFLTQAGTKRINSLTTTVSFYNLDRKVMPQKGDKFSLSMEYAGGVFSGDVDYYKLFLNNDYYIPLKNLTFHSKTVVGYLKGFSATPDYAIPLYERFFGGGIDTNAPIRGYQERSLGPQLDGYVIGGTNLFAENLELLYPVKEDILWGVVFYDVGNVWDGWDFSNLKSGVGVGLRIKVPLFPVPIQLDYGWALNRTAGESPGHLSFGMSMGF